MNVEENYLDILQNIEAAVASAFRDDEDLVDYDVEKAYDALIRTYQAENRKREPRTVDLSPERAQRVYEVVRSLCDWRLRRDTSLTVEGNGEIPAPEPVSLDVIIACLKRLRKSVRYWTRQRGYQGYLTFISSYV